MKEKVLIALNDSSLAKALADKLALAKYNVDMVSGGTEIIDKLKMVKPDLLIIDLILPDKSGYEILQEKSFDKDVTKIPVIIVSNSGAPLQMKEIPSTPTIKDYIVKSHVEPSEVLEKVEKVFGRGIPAATVAPSQQSEQEFAGKSPKKILWAEDDKLLGTILSKKIETTGFKLFKASNDSQVEEILEKETPDIILLDIMLPEMSGLDILQKIKKQDKYKNIPVIMLSNLSKQSDVDKAKVLGANRFIVKAAVSLDEIIKEIHGLLRD